MNPRRLAVAAMVGLVGQAVFVAAYGGVLAEHYAHRAQREAIAGQIPTSATFAEKSLALNPRQGYAAFFLGLAERKRGRTAAAADAFRGALETMAHRARPLRQLAECEEELGQPAQAAEHLAEALAIAPLPPGGAASPRARLGRLYYGRGRWADGMAQFRAVTADAPANRFHFQGLAAGYERFGALEASAACAFALLGSPSLVAAGCKQLERLAQRPEQREMIVSMLREFEATLAPDDPRRDVIASSMKALALLQGRE